MSIASATTTQTSAAAAAVATASAGGSATPSAASSLTQLAGNFQDFLSLLTTQLQNQDPTAPLDTNQFTSQLVQFTSVQEQINTNATLGQLLTATQAQQLTQASSLVGKTVDFTSPQLPLQGGTGSLQFQSATAQPVQVSIADANGTVVQSATVDAVAGSNSWTWNGATSGGGTEPDGSYTAGVTGVTAAGVSGAMPFTVSGIVTGAEQVNSVVQLMFGSQAVGFGSVVSLGAPAN
jgi:flagellar basal-body rod modification protein FlgD